MKEKIKPLSVFGLGYVGLPLSLTYAMKGYKVYGIDVSEGLVENLEKGNCRHMESFNGKSIDSILSECLAKGTFIPSCQPGEAIKNSDKFIVTVGIPDRGPLLDFCPIINACRTISKGLKINDTIIIRSTLVPGTVEEKIIPVFKESGLNPGEEIFLAYCPERISEGNAFQEFQSVQVIISGINRKSIEKGREIIKLISNVEPFEVSSIKTAETAKLMESIHRDVNIAIANQFAEFSKKLNIDTFELVDAINTHPRVNLLKPGPGVGGYCIPNALHYIMPKSIEIKAHTDLFEHAREINSEIPGKIVDMVLNALESAGKNPDGLKISLLGMAMKDKCSDVRKSPAIEILDLLIKKGLKVKAYDCCVYSSHPSRVDSLTECIKDADCILITAVQESINYNDFRLFKKMMKPNPIIIDTRNVVDKSKASKEGFEIISI